MNTHLSQIARPRPILSLGTASGSSGLFGC